MIEIPGKGRFDENVFFRRVYGRTWQELAAAQKPAPKVKSAKRQQRGRTR